MKQKLNRDEYLVALGLFALARNHYKVMRDAELALIALLEYEADDCGGHVSDELYKDGDASLDYALRKEKVVIPVLASVDG